MLLGMWKDLKFAIRTSLKSPDITLLIVVTFGLGIGINTAVFSLVYNVLFASLPYKDDAQLVRLQQHQPKAENFDFRSSVQSIFDYRDMSSSLSHVAEYHSMTFTLYGHGLPQEVQTGVVSWNYFEMLGVTPVLGRFFNPKEDEVGAEPLIILTNKYWRTQFNSSDSVIGMNLEMNNKAHKIIGVLPPLPAYPHDNDIFIAAATCPFRGRDSVIENRASGWFDVYAKIKASSTIELANKDVGSVATLLAQQYPDAYPANKGYSASLVSLKKEMVGDSTQSFLLLLAMASLIIFIASANVANLSLVKLSGRTQEFAIREAVGASSSEISRLILVESVLLSIVGGGLGIAIAFLSLDFLKEFASGFTTLSSEVDIDFGVLLFSLVASILAGLISGGIAILNRGNINKSLKEGGSKVTASVSGRNARTYLLLIQLALSFVILCSSMLVAFSLYKLTTEELGFDADNVLTMTLNLNFSNYQNGQQIREFQERLIGKISLLPGVDKVSTAGGFPLAGNLDAPVPFELENLLLNADDIRPRAEANTVSPEYHRLLNIPLYRGRFLDIHDDENNLPVVIINQAMESRYFPNGDAIGSRLSVNEGANWLTIVGVVANAKSSNIKLAPAPAFYTPFAQNPTSGIELLVKAKGEPKLLIPTIEKSIFHLDPQQAISDSATLKEIKMQSMASSRLIAMLVLIFSIVAFVITLSGVFGVIAFNVKQRTKEIGIRMSIGATESDIFALLLKDGLRNTMVGITIGGGIMFYVEPTLKPHLFKVDSSFFSIFATSIILILCAVAIAMAIPAKKATTIDPNEALREE